jgi:hypothetical protein
MVSARFAHRTAVAAAAFSALLAMGLPSAAAAPATDNEGYVDSSARCASPATAVLFGATDSSRVAICKTSDGSYEYRGVRVSDGAKLIVPATQSADGKFVAENDGVTYTLTAKSLVISAGGTVVREDPMTDVHNLAPPAAPATPAAPTTSAAPTTPAAPATPAAPTTTATSTTPLPPPLPAEVGGSR